MSNEKHTPGPWRITNEGYDSYGTYRYQIGTHEITIAYTWCPCDFATPPQAMTANARLIAAAPDMLEALKKIAKIGREDYGPAAAARMDEIARAAIAKAEGRL